ncbi:MAG: (Fe-S)-binding protein [Chloroflexi bacterium]|nr:(Fe-S)-binding protein [Chloroflexota bacterium]
MASETTPTNLYEIDRENIEHCGRCGLCLAVCPTYRDTGLETQSPRGRAQLIRAAVAGDLAAGENLRRHAYHCMDCRACESACPSGVQVSRAVIALRAQMEEGRPQPFLKNLVLRHLIPYPKRLEYAILPLRLYQRSGLERLLRKTGLLDRLPGPLPLMADLLPPLRERPLHLTVREITLAKGERKHRVGFFLGCAMSFLFPKASRATLHVLSENGCEVFTPRGQVCCGAPHSAEGDIETLKELARRNIDLFSADDLDTIVADCAACGAMLKDYVWLLAKEPGWAERAKAFSAKVKDFSEFLAGIPLSERLGEIKRRVTYHDPCHLKHAQGISVPPRELLQRIPGLDLAPMPEPDWCCGSAGIYNLTHTARSLRILERTMDNIASTRADVVVAGNPGCLLQMRLGAQHRRMPLWVVHPSELLSEAYRTGNAE